MSPFETIPAEFDWCELARDVAARTGGIERSRGAEAARVNAAWVIELEDEARRLHEPAAAAWRAFWRALMLAPTLEIAEALLRGDAVSLDRLDAQWVARFGRRSP